MYDTTKFIPLVNAVKEITGIDKTHFKRVIAELEKPQNKNQHRANAILTEEKFGFQKSIYEKIKAHMQNIHLRSTFFTDEKTKENSVKDRQACEAFLSYYHNEIANNDELDAKVSPSP